MTTQAHRGGAPVGHLDELPDLEAAAILYLRFWLAGDALRERARADLHATLGSGDGDQATEALQGLVEMISRHARRPLMRHQPGCRCFGGDEAAFANFIGAAAHGQREDAILIATLIFRADMAFISVSLAERLGIHLKRLTSRLGTGALPAAQPAPARVLH
ncbi:MAG: hypothetical protein ACK5MQ_16480 [Pikeienuella sp.]